MAATDNTTTNLNAIDNATARLTQALAVTSLLEGSFLEAIDGGNSQPYNGIENAAEVLWSIKEMISQAREAVRAIRVSPALL